MQRFQGFLPQLFPNVPGENTSAATGIGTFCIAAVFHPQIHRLPPRPQIDPAGGFDEEGLTENIQDNQIDYK
jgi:hypothetical protein